MTGFYLALVAVMLAGFGARDQLILASISQAQPNRPALLITGALTATAATALIVWASQAMGELRQPDARTWLGTFALVIAGIELLAARRARKMEQPTPSLGALALVLLARQVLDAARLLVFALCVSTGAPVAVALGGVSASLVLLWFAWAHPQVPLDPRVFVYRKVAGALLLGAALVFALELLRVL